MKNQDTTIRPAEVRKALFRADWDDAAFVHYALDPQQLQPLVPFELDLYEGHAYVSLVAFTQRGLRPTFGGRITASLSAPVASHPFLNVRTYVRHAGEPGIYFLCEWIPNRLAALIGPPLYGLPYHVARLRYEYHRNRGASDHQIAAGGLLEFNVSCDTGAEFRAVEPGSRDEFLLERYTAFTRCRGRNMGFRVSHGPWPQKQARVVMGRTDLLERLGLPLTADRPIAANISPGVKGVGLSAPIHFRPKGGARELRIPRARSPRTSPAVAWLPLLVFLTLALAIGRHLPGWVWMWCIAGGLFAGFKWLTWWQEPARCSAPRWRSAAYLLAWVGMDAAAFLNLRRPAELPTLIEWTGALARTFAGAILVWAICPRLPGAHPFVLGWTGMLGMILLLHFGTFDLLALFWRARGIDATPLMRQPIRARSLADFWGNRWNTAFHQLTGRYVFRPLARVAGVPVAVMGSFVLSGLIHDLVISVPARAGYGLPTAYFTLQGAGVLLERSQIGRRVGLDRGAVGRAWTMLVTASPAWLLFHPPFVVRVILPFLHAIGATQAR